MKNPKPKRDGQKVWTGAFTVSWPHLVEPNERFTPSYQVVALFDPRDKTLDLLKEAAKEAWSQKFGKKRLPDHKIPISDGSDDDHCDKDGYDGKMFCYFKCNAKYNRPKTYDERNHPMEDEEIEEKIYGGARCRATVYVNAYDNEQSGIHFLLNAIQYISPGRELNERASGNTDDDFDDDYTKNRNDDDYDLDDE